ncbi:MAG: TonB-dependent receptor [Gemmatimonadales bacterium]|nr:TonB-dependent receptor [Gemmatimonadales bacterium]
MRLPTSLLASTRAGSLLVALGGLFLTAIPAAAQGGTGTVRGTVTQSGNNQPLVGVLVTVEGTSIKASTNTRGQYTIERAPTGPHTIVFRWLGYRPLSVQTTIAASGVTTADAVLEQLPIQLSELMVTGASKVPERAVEAPAAFAIVPPRVMQAAGITGQAPLALREVPGVDLAQSGMNDFNVNARGFNSSLNRRVLVLQDGRDLAIAFLGSQEWNALAVPTDEFSKMELVRGPGSALYGANAFFGVLNITTPSAREVVGTKVTLGGGFQKPTRNDGTTYGGSTMRFDFRHAGTVSQGRFGYRVNAGFNQADAWSQPRTSADGRDLKREYGDVVEDSVAHPIPVNRELRALNGQTANLATGVITGGDPDPVKNFYGAARVDYYANNGSVVTAEVGSADVRNEIFVTGIGRVQVTKALRPYARLGWASERFNVMAYWNGRRTRKPQYALASNRELKETSDIFHIEGQEIRSFNSDKGRVVYGMSIRNYQVNTKSTLMLAANDDRSDYYYGAFAQVDYQLHDKLRAVVATRVDLGSLIDPQLSPKAALVFSPNDANSIRFTVNRAFQMPNYSEFYLRAPAGAPVDFRALEAGMRASALGPALATVPNGTLFTNSAVVPVFASGNAKLNVETTLGFELGYRADLSRSVYLTVDGYVNRIRNFVTDLLPGVNPAFPFWTAPSQMTVAAQRTALQDAVKAQLLASPATALAGRGLTRTEDGRTAILVSYTNAGKVTQWGLEAGAGWQMNKSLRGDATLTVFDYNVKDAAVGDSLLANTPSAKGTLSLSYAGDRLSASGNVRLVKGYSWAAGVFNGYIEPSTTFNLDAGYDLNTNFKVFVTAQNVFDARRFEVYGGSVNGRRILGGVTTRF